MKNKKQAYTIFLIITASVLMLGSCRKEKIKPEQADKFIKFYGKGGTQKAGNVAVTPDGGYILVGTSDSYGNGKDILVVKTDQFGNEKWSKVLGGAGDDEGNWVIVSSNGNYIVVGSKAEAGGITSDVYVAELNAAGSIVGENTYGESGQNDAGVRIINTLDKGYAIVGTAFYRNISDPIKDSNAVYILKINNGKIKEWDARYGEKVVLGTSIQQYSDLDFITSAYTNVPDMLITTGQFQTNSFSYAPKSDLGKDVVDLSIVRASDILKGANKSKYILGSTNSGNVFVAHVDSNEVKIFYKTFDAFPQSTSSSFSKTNDGGFVIAASIITNGNSDILIVRTDANANPIWSKTFGGTGNDYGVSVEQKSDGSFIVSGTIAFGGNGTGANSVLSLIHIDSNGELK